MTADASQGPAHGGGEEHEHFDRVIDDIEGDPDGVKITVGEVLEALGRRGFGPLLLFPAVIAILPIIGALPGVSLSMAFIELLIAPQIVVGRLRPWVPRRLLTISFRRERLVRAVEPLRPLAKWLQRWTRMRLKAATQGPGIFLVGVNASVLAVGMGLGALVPGGIVPASLIMIVLAIGLTARDGYVVLISHAMTAALVTFSVRWVAPWVISLAG